MSENGHPLARWIVRGRYELILPNDLNMFRAVIELCREELGRVGVADAATHHDVALAMEEALQNALQHGNLEIDSTSREQGGRTFFQLLEQRAAAEPYCQRRIHVAITTTPAEAVYVVRDEGRGFDLATAEVARHDDAPPKPHGRGLLLIRESMDEVRHGRGGAEITMIKRLG